MNTNMPKNVYQIMRFYRWIAVANAVQAAHGNVMDFEDAQQEGKLLAGEAYKSADPRKGDIWQYIALRMTAARQEARELAMEPVESESDITPARGDEDEDAEPVMETFEDVTGEPNFDRPEWEQYGELTGVADLNGDQLAMLVSMERHTFTPPADTDGSADEKAPTYVHLVPKPEKVAGEAFSIYGMDPDYVQPDGFHKERLTSMQDHEGNWPDSEPETIFGVNTRLVGPLADIGAGGVEMEADWIDDVPELKTEEELEDDMGYEYYSAIPTEEEVEAGLAETFEVMATFPCKYSPQSREAFIRAMIHGAGMKAAQAVAWAVHKGVAVKVRPQGLELGNGRVVAWGKAMHVRLSQPEYAVCAKLVTDMPSNKAAMAWVDSRVAL